MNQSTSMMKISKNGKKKARLAKTPDELVESLSMATRIKLRNAMRKNKAKIAQKRKIAL